MKTSITFYSAVLSLLTGFAAQAQGVIHPATNSYNDGPSQFSAFPATPPAYNAAAKVNFVRSWIPRKPITNVADVNTQADRYIDQATNYVDGLGRPLQAVQRAATATGRDIIQYHVYDAYGRETHQYMPFADIEPGLPSPGNSISDGNFRTNAMLRQEQFFTELSNSNPYTQGEKVFYTKTEFESSPLSRKTAVYGTGNEWAVYESATRMAYELNTAEDLVQHWVIGSTPQSIPEAVDVYTPGRLFKLITADENGNRVEEYKNDLGQVILKKVEVDEQNPDPYQAWLWTYYVYDDFYLLRCVISPQAVKVMGMAADWQVQPLLDELCFVYQYDQRNRMYYKKIPGAAPVYMVYDARDRLVMTQDGNMQTNQQWLCTVYDPSNRPVKTFLRNNDGDDYAYHAAEAAGAINYPDQTLASNTVLSTTDYDGPSNTLVTTDLGYLTAGANLYSEPVQNSKITYGKVVASMSKDLQSSSKEVITQFCYDEKGRVIQSYTEWGKFSVRKSTMYDYTGKPLCSYEKHLVEEPATNIDIRVLTKLQYDDGGRLKKVLKQLNNDGVDHEISKLEYDEQNKIKRKDYGTDPAQPTTALESVTYDYNLRGWLTGMNRSFLGNQTTNQHWFGQTISYDHGFTNDVGTSRMFNGNISGITWKSRGDGVSRAYGFDYDAANRLLRADFTQNNGTGSWEQDVVNFSMTMGNGNVSEAYDANGNILSMQQWGLKLNQSSLIDNLVYTYQNEGKSNKLLNVIDVVNDPTTTLGDFRSSNRHPDYALKQQYSNAPGSVDPNQIEDYQYDANGNLTRDYNKDIGNRPNNSNGIRYNFLNLPREIEFFNDNQQSRGLIQYTYDATGNKLKKSVTENDNLTETAYFAGIVYERKQVTGQPTAPWVQQFISHEEGRIRWADVYPETGNPEKKWCYDYFLKDHLGNVRMVLTEQQNHFKYFAGFEDNRQTIEPVLFNNINETRIAINNVNGQYNNAYPADPVTDPNAYTSKLNGNGRKIGVSKVLRVMSGDHLQMGVKYWYPNVGSGTGNSTPDDMIQVLVGLISNGVEGASGGKVLSTQLGGSNSILLPGLNQVLNHMPDDNGIAHPPPQAYLNWMLFDEQFNLVGESSGYDRVSGYDTAIRALTGDVDIVKNGYLFVYVSNETPSKDVFFDNLAISHTSGPLMEETHYYPFGLVMSGISSKAASTLENRYKYNGKELQNHEFSDGSGLELYDFGARDQDPQIGRWWTIDPLANKKIWLSPYNFCSNNPINNIDPNGLTDFAINKKTGEVKQVGEKNDDPDRLLKTNRRGIVKTGKSGPKVAIDNIEKGILKDGMNFKKNDNLIAVGQQGQPSVNGVQSFTLQLSNYVGVEIGGALLSKDKSSQTDFVALGYFKDNTITSTKSNGQGVWGSNKVTEMFHTHTNASSEEKIIPSQSDRRTRDGNLEIKPNMKFTIITEPTRSDDPYPKKIDFSSVTEYPTD